MEGTSLLLLESAGEGQQPCTQGQGQGHPMAGSDSSKLRRLFLCAGVYTVAKSGDNNILQNILSSTELITIISNNALPMHLALLLENSAKGPHLPELSSCKHFSNIIGNKYGVNAVLRAL